MRRQTTKKKKRENTRPSFPPALPPARRTCMSLAFTIRPLTSSPTLRFGKRLNMVCEEGGEGGGEADGRRERSSSG